LLTGGKRTALPRHQTLQALIDWSYELLTPAEQALLRRLAVFAGGWTLEAAESVGAGDGVAAGDVFDLLGRLIDKSLVQGDVRAAMTWNQWPLGNAERALRLSVAVPSWLFDKTEARGWLEGALTRADAEQVDFQQARAEALRELGGLDAGLADYTSARA